jgi:hypothetical protein
MDEDKDFHTGNLRYGNEPLTVWGAVPGMAEPEWVAECVLFADRPENREKDRQLIALAKARRAQSSAPTDRPSAAAMHHHEHH